MESKFINSSIPTPLLLSPPSKPPLHRNLTLTLTSFLNPMKVDFPPYPFSRRTTIIDLAAAAASLSLTTPAFAKVSSPQNPAVDGISSTVSWPQFFGDGFSLRIPPSFVDINEPEDYSAGQTLYGDKAKPKIFAARFASTDGSEVLSVVIQPSNKLKLTFLEAKDITDIGSLKESAKIFVPGGANLYAARAYRIKEKEVFRTYYFYEFEIDGQHVAVTTSLDSGKAYISGATAPQVKWKDDGIKLRSAALSLTVL